MSPIKHLKEKSLCEIAPTEAFCLLSIVRLVSHNYTFAVFLDSRLAFAALSSLALARS
jgi:hypothetical protein